MDELLELLRAKGWTQDEAGDYVRGRYYVAVLPRGIIHVGLRPPSAARPDTNKWGDTRSLPDAIAWVREKSSEDLAD